MGFAEWINEEDQIRYEEHVIGILLMRILPWLYTAMADMERLLSMELSARIIRRISKYDQQSHGNVRGNSRVGSIAGTLQAEVYSDSEYLW